MLKLRERKVMTADTITVETEFWQMISQLVERAFAPRRLTFKILKSIVYFNKLFLLQLIRVGLVVYKVSSHPRHCIM